MAVDLAALPPSARRWPGYRGDDALLNLMVVCLNCGWEDYRVEETTVAQSFEYFSMIESVESCSRCGWDGVLSVARVYEGRLERGSVYRNSGV